MELSDWANERIVANFVAACDATRDDLRQAIGQYARPSVLYRPTLTRDGNQWCAIYGDNLQVGVVAFGDSPEKAMEAFDEAWAGIE